MNIKKLIREEIDSFDWAKEDTIHFEVGTCLEFHDGRKYMVTSFSKTPSGTEILNTVTRMGNRGTWKSKGLSKSHVEEDLNNGTMTYCYNNIRESNEFEWTDEIEGIHIGMCFSRTNTSAKYRVISITNRGVVTSTGVAQTRRIVHWDKVELLGYLSNGTLTVCQDHKV